MSMNKSKISRKKLILAVAMLPFLLLSAQAFGQSASLSGTVTDASEAVLPGASITATNTETGVTTTMTTNNAGVYNMALQPGTYEVSAEMPGFQTSTRTDVTVGVAAALRLNFELEVAGVATQIEVSTSAADLLLESSSSTGTVMNEHVVKDLPLVGNDILQLINVMGGVVREYDTVFGNANQTFAGVGANNVNIARDGITVSDVRYGSGIVSPSRLNPEMVGEFKMVLTPVDAEMGRGAGQIQVMTKSGGNEYHGSGVWSVINTALDANEWDANRTGDVPSWMNANQYTISVGGPIIKNKTFFFATWDQNIVRQKVTVTPAVLTPCARKGIFRWFAAGPESAPGIPGWINGNYDDPINTTFNSWTRSTVTDLFSGDPAYEYTLDPDDPNATVYRDELQYQSVLGELTDAARAQIAADPVNCSQFNFSPNSPGVIPGSAWNSYRSEYDQSGFIEGFTAIMPEPNYYGSVPPADPFGFGTVGDGLNLAGHRWTRTMKGQDTVYGAGMNSQRKQITVKIDHNLNAEHRLSGTWSYESSFSDSGEADWPEPYGYGGAQDRKPQTFTTSLTSTLKPTLLNELRFGLAYNESHNIEPYEHPSTGEELKELMNSLLPTDNFPQWAGLPMLIRPGSGEFRTDSGASHPVGGRWNVEGTWGNNDYRWTIADTITWTKGSHSFKGGTEIRLSRANADMNGTTFSVNTYPIVSGGNTPNSLPSGSLAGSNFGPGLVGSDSGENPSGNYGLIYGLLNYTAGSVSSISQYYFTDKPDQTNWSVPSTPEGLVRRLAVNQNEYSFFFKDDWKVNADLTLNLGVRYEYYGVPHVKNGMTIGIVGGPLGLFGGGEQDYSTWHRAIDWNSTGDPDWVPQFDFDKLTELEFIGPGSPNPDRILIDKDLNNFAPAVGFAWQLPWFGRGKTTLRGGYQLSYLTIDRLDPNAGLMGASGSSPGTVFTDTYTGDNIDVPYMNLAMLSDLVPTSRFWDANTPQPLQTRLVTDGSAGITAIDQNIVSPYVQSLTLALTRQVTSSLTVDVRYIGTLSRKGISQVDLNQNNWIRNGLKDELAIVRAGGESEMINAMIPPGTISFWPPASGSEQLRTSFYTSNDIAQGDFDTIATYLATDNGTIPTPSSVQGQILRNTGLFPENFIRTNPQFSTATYWSNQNRSNYHSMQVQVTLRPTHGLNFQTTYTWSRNMGIGGPADPLDRDAAYRILGSHRLHNLVSYGTYNLPLGANGFLFRDSSGWVKKLVEGWQLSWVGNITSGTPGSITAASSLWGGGMPDLVRPDLFDTKSGHVTWAPGARSGRYFGDDVYMQVIDPVCSNDAVVAPSLQGACGDGLKALAIVAGYDEFGEPIAGDIVFQHALPGERGNFQQSQIYGPGRWGLDLAMSKNIEFMEGKSINFRMDATNIFNHPTPSGGGSGTQNGRDYTVSNPVMGINSSSPFGYIGSKGGHRVFSAKIRISF